MFNLGIKESTSVRTATTEQDLLEGLAKNDREAIETIYKQHYNMVQSMILSNSGYPEDARDIFQEAMIVLYEKARSGSFELNSQLKTYLYSVCRRLWLKRLNQVQQGFTGSGRPGRKDTGGGRSRKTPAA